MNLLSVKIATLKHKAIAMKAALDGVLTPDLCTPLSNKNEVRWLEESRMLLAEYIEGRNELFKIKSFWRELTRALNVPVKMTSFPLVIPKARMAASSVIEFINYLESDERLKIHNPISHCANPDCDMLFLKNRSHQKTCSPKCRMSIWYTDRAIRLGRLI